jgi:aminoglycoside phosphotransferase family enzyme
MDLDNKTIEKYLKEKYEGRISSIEIKKLGSGVLGTGYSLKFKVDDRSKTLVLKSLFKENLGMDHYSDRASSLLDAHDNYNKMENHVKSEDVIAQNDDNSLTSIGKAKEFYILMEEARGEDLFKDFDKIKESGKLSEEVRKKILVISDFLVKLHKNKHESVPLYRRKIRDTIGSGGSLIGLLDMHPDPAFKQFESKWMEIVMHSIKFWRKSRNMDNRLCEIHADYHPGNLWFENGNFTILDRSRGRYGEPADDIVAFAINPIMYSLMTTGEFEGPFREMFDIFWNNYFKQTKDREMRKIMAPYIAFRVSVVTNPIFYNDEMLGGKDKATKIRSKMINLALNILKDNEFSPEKINFYLISE